MATQLTLYNGALRKLKERPLSTLSDPVKSRRELDSVWNSGIVRYCLEQGYWNFAMRTAKFTPEMGFTAGFGYKNKFAKPADFVRLGALSHDEFFRVPNNGYVDEAGAWYSDSAVLYVSYVSDDPSYGASLVSWPESFTDYVEWVLAEDVAGVLTGASLSTEFSDRAVKNARSKDAMNEPTKFMPTGSFVSARRGSQGRERGNRNSLIG